MGTQAQQLVGGVVAGKLEKALAKPLGLDTIEVEAGKEPGTGSVSVGRYVTQDIFLSYERELGNKSDNTKAGNTRAATPLVSNIVLSDG